MKQSNVLTINQDRNRKRIKQCNLCGSLAGQKRRLLAFFTLVCSSLTGGYEAKPTCPTAAPGAQDGMAALYRDCGQEEWVGGSVRVWLESIIKLNKYVV